MPLINFQSQHWARFIVYYYGFLFNSCLGTGGPDDERRRGPSDIDQDTHHNHHHRRQQQQQQQQQLAPRHSTLSTYSVSVLAPIESLVPTILNTINTNNAIAIAPPAKMTGPVHNSAVYVLGHPQHTPAIPPPSPPSPVTPSDSPELCAPIEELSLDNDIVRPHSPSPPDSPATPRIAAYGGKQSTAPSSVSSPASSLFDDRLSSAVHVLNTEATSLNSLTEFYATDPAARSSFNVAVETITSRSRGKLVIIGVGKSGHIARKLVATFNSLSIYASFMHPTEALHGDLGHVGPDDTLMLITFSGKTPELSLLMPHLDARLPLIVLTGRTMEAEVVKQREGASANKTILLPAPIHESETVSFGVSAPTTSTTMALAVGDALALTCAQELNPGAGGVAGVFGRNHPGGAIGATYRGPQSLRDVMVPLDDISVLAAAAPAATKLVGGDVLRAAYTCKTGWLRVGADAVVPPSRIRRLTSAELASDLAALPWLTVDRAGLLSLGAATQLKDAGEWLRGNMAAALAGAADDEDLCTPESVVAVVDGGEIVGVLEASAILDATA